MVRNGPFTSLLGLKSARNAMREAGAFEDLQKAVCISQYFKRLSISPGSEALSTLVKLQCKMFAELKTNPVTARHVQLQFTASAQCSGYQAPTLRDRHAGTTVTLPETSF